MLVRVEKRRSNSITPRLWQHLRNVYFEMSSTAVKASDICVTNVDERNCPVKFEANLFNVLE